MWRARSSRSRSSLAVRGRCRRCTKHPCHTASTCADWPYASLGARVPSRPSALQGCSMRRTHDTRRDGRGASSRRVYHTLWRPKTALIPLHRHSTSVPLRRNPGFQIPGIRNPCFTSAKYARVRGNRPKDVVAAVGTRSIPACAGKPSRSTSQHPPARVNPRVCGETAIWIRWSPKCRGPSPRVRGNRLLFGRGRVDVGSIPACAGKPVTRVRHRTGLSGSIPACAGKP